MGKPLVVYLQYTNPAGYPPLEHSAAILAGKGWNVLFLGAGAFGAESLMLPEHASIEVRRLPSFGSGIAQRLNYLTYIVWALIVCMLKRPKWIYASDPLSCLPALVARAFSNSQVIYHEHDSPSSRYGSGVMQRVVSRARRSLARSATLCIVPQSERLKAFVSETGRTGPTYCVWNCPSLQEVSKPRPVQPTRQPLQFYYHGSINAERLPLSILDALKDCSADATLAIVGYETIGSRGHLAHIRQHAEDLGLGTRVSYLGSLPKRGDMLAAAARSDVGIALMPTSTSDINMQHMTGASNKPFDYLSAGQMLLVSDLSDWRDMFVEPGYAVACDPADKVSLATAMRWCVDNPEKVRTKGEAGRQRILSEWNYDDRFEEVARLMSSPKSNIDSQ